ncbi:MAG TPA: hypothetical protein VKQ30_01190 [Ktedonobacterales bacterium]|nr:hypothetical protein [Ktedonobacterales bacterium]
MTWRYTSHGHGRGRRGTSRTGRSKHGKAGVHGRGRSGSPLAYMAKKDAWKHVGQARGQGGSKAH